MPDDLTTVLEWARKRAPADVRNAACRVLEGQPPATDEGLRERIAAALHGTYPADWHGPVAAECTTCQTRARAIMAVVSPALARLRADLAHAQEAINQLCDDRDVNALLKPVEAERDALKAAIAEVRRLCDLTIAASCRRDAIDQAIDTLAVLDRTLGAPDATTEEKTDEG